MAILKHIAIKNSNYDAALDYLTMQHNEFTMKPVLGDDGRQLPREEYILDGINCNPYTFGMECESVNAYFQKNQNRDEVKTHHYIISFDPRDRDENGLTLESAQSLALEFAKKNFPGHQALVCAHPDGHNSAGNIHVHIVINSVRAIDVEIQDFMERSCDAKAGYKHHVTKELLSYLKQETMTLCQENSLYQVDLLSPAKVRITDREYWAERRGQDKLDKDNKKKIENGEPVTETKYETDKGFLRRVISDTMADGRSYEDFIRKLYENYGISVHESRGQISYLLPDHNRPIRGRQLGTDYEKDFIESVLRQKSTPVRNDLRLVTDLENCKKAQQNPYYAQKVKITNLQQLSKVLAFIQDNNIATIEEFDRLVSSVSDDFTSKDKALKATEARIKKTNLLIKNTGQYLANKDIYKQYLSAKNKAKFRVAHRAEITLYEAARKFLQENYAEKGSEAKSVKSTEKAATQKKRIAIPSIKTLRAEKEELTRLKNQQYEEYSFVKAKHRELQIIRHNIHTALGISPEQAKERNATAKKKEQSI